MNRKIYCYPTIMAALAASAAMGWAMPAQAQAFPAAAAADGGGALAEELGLASRPERQLGGAVPPAWAVAPYPPALAAAPPEPVRPQAKAMAPQAAAQREGSEPPAVQQNVIQMAEAAQGAIAPAQSLIAPMAADSVLATVTLAAVQAGAQAATELSPQLADSSVIPAFRPEGELAPTLRSLAQAPEVPSGDLPEVLPEEDLSPADLTPPAQTPAAEPSSEPRVLVAEVQVVGVEGNPEEALLTDAVYNAIQTSPGQPTTGSQLQADLNAIFATGYFADVDFRPEDTPLGVRVTFLVQPNPILSGVSAPDTQVLPPEEIDAAFSAQYGRTLNFNDLQNGVQRINSWYQDNGYVLAQVVDATQISADGRVNLVIAEGIVDSIDVRFLDADGNPTNPETEEPVRGRTKPYIVTREFSLQPGDVFRRGQAEADLQRVFGLGIFEDVRLSLDPSADDPRKVVVVANVIEARTGSIGASGGVSSASGLFGSFSVGQENFRGRNQKLRSEITLGQRDFLFDLGFTDPWIKGDPYRTSYTVNAFRRRSISLIYSGGDQDVDLPNGDTPRILRLGGGLRFSRPLSKNVFEPAEWNASLGLQYERVSIRDEDGDNEFRDEFGNDLTFSGDESDDLILLQFGLARDRRNNRLQPTQGSITRLNLDQSLPFGSGSILLNRLRVNHSQFVPVRFLRLTEGCRQPDPSPTDCAQTLAFNVQAGTILGDLPPYEAFSIGGANSVRGYGEGEVGSGRSFLQATAEYRFPVFSFVGGALFADFGTDLGTGDNVPGNPAGIREKPGSGYGVGLGVRIQSPLGPIRADYAVLTDDGDTRFQFGIGQRF